MKTLWQTPLYQMYTFQKGMNFELNWIQTPLRTEYIKGHRKLSPYNLLERKKTYHKITRNCTLRFKFKVHIELKQCIMLQAHTFEIPNRFYFFFYALALRLSGRWPVCRTSVHVIMLYFFFLKMSRKMHAWETSDRGVLGAIQDVTICILLRTLPNI